MAPPLIEPPYAPMASPSLTSANRRTNQSRGGSSTIHEQLEDPRRTPVLTSGCRFTEAPSATAALAPARIDIGVPLHRRKKNKPGNREPKLVTEARLGAAEVGSTRVGEAVSAEVSGRRSAAGPPVGRRRGRHQARGGLHIESDNCGGAVAGGSTREGKVTPSSVRRAWACLRVEWRRLMVRLAPQGQRNTSVPKVRW